LGQEHHLKPRDKMDPVVSRKFIGPARWILILVSAGILIYGAALLYTCIETGDILFASVGGALALVGLMGCVAVPRQRTVVTDEYVENRCFATVRIAFDEVAWAQLHLGELIISDNHRSVRVNRVAQNGRLLFNAAVEQLRRRPEIDLRGDPETLAIHFGPVAR
jgi:hypothetical protein